MRLSANYLERSVIIENVRTTEQLRDKICEAARNVEAEDAGVAFSGGVDSSLLAKVCRDLGKKITLLTVSFSSQRDIKTSTEVSRELGLSLLDKLIDLEELEEGLKTVLATIDFDRIVRLENCVGFFYVFRLASKHRLNAVLSANGMDELFCGYDAYRSHFGDEAAMKSLMDVLVETARRDKEETDKLAALFGVEYLCPFLSDSFVNFAMNIPLDLKIKSNKDRIRKHVLREVALELGVPESAALRAKKAFQYSSGIHDAITKLAKKKGFTGRKAKEDGFRSGTDAYVRTLQESIGHINHGFSCR